MLLQRGYIDIIRKGTTENLEQRFQAVPIPLFAGLLGYRVSFIRRDKRGFFEDLNPSELRELVACQGERWADSDILEANGFAVKRVSSYRSMLKMLIHGRCDYFPRAIHEAAYEIHNIKSEFPEIEIFSKHILHYDFPVFIFVRKNEKQLANDLTDAFNEFIDTGKFNVFLQQNPLTRAVFPLKQWHEANFIQLSNPLLSSNVPIQEPKYWLNLMPDELRSYPTL